jgi:transcriptional regulator with XRE-family HTH domain
VPTLLDPKTLRTLREAKGWNQQALAEAAGIDPSVISRLERGLQSDLRASVLIALADALSTPVDTLLTPPHKHTTPTALAELVAVIYDIQRLSDARQRQVAAILRAYLAMMPEQEG